jgi:hypothetical protein
MWARLAGFSKSMVQNFETFNERVTFIERVLTMRPGFGRVSPGEEKNLVATNFE